MTFANLSWRDRVRLVNSVLFCLLGGALIARYVMGQAASLVLGLGIALLAFGAYRLVLARREMRKRAGGSSGE